MVVKIYLTNSVIRSLKDSKLSSIKESTVEPNSEDFHYLEYGHANIVIITKKIQKIILKI